MRPHAAALDRPSGGSGDGFDTAGPGSRWTTGGIAEMLPGVLPPLRWSVAGRLLDEALRRLLADVGALDDRITLDAPVVARIGGRGALSVDVVDALAARSMAASVAAGGPAGGDAPRGARGWRERARRAREDLRLVRLRRVASCEAESCVVAAATVVAEPLDLTAMTVEALLGYRSRLLDLAGRTATAEAGVAAAAAAAYQHLERSLVIRLGDEQGRAWALRVTSGSVATPSDWLRELAGELMRSSPVELRGALAGADTAEEAESVLAAGAAGEAALAAWRDAARRAGSRAVFAGPTWDEDRRSSWPTLRAELRAGAAGEPAHPVPPQGPGRAPRDPAWLALAEALRALPGWRRARILTGQVIDVRLHVLARLREDAVVLLDRRERAKAALLAVGGEVRRVHLELGRRLTARCVLDGEEDIELLGEAELHPALGGRGPVRAELERRRRWLASAAVDPALSSPAGPAPVPGDLAPGAGPEVLRGVAASPGEWSGPARVLSSVDEGDTLMGGEVLVARTTDPSWTPLVMMAGALVVEEGGMLSHAAILARELHIPAVVGVPGVMDRLRQGMFELDVDGGAGTLVVRPGAEPAPLGPEAVERGT